MATWASGKIGWNFRDTLAYVTDGAKEIFMCGDYTGSTRLYANGPYTTQDTTTDVACGWLTAVNCRNWLNSDGPHLAGANWSGDGQTNTFRVDVPAAGDYSLHLALGMRSENWSGLTYYVAWSDDNSTWHPILNSVGGTVAHEFYDASGVKRSPSGTDETWTENEVGITVTLSGTAFYLKLGNGVVHQSPLAHMTLELVEATTAPPTTLPPTTAAPTTISTTTPPTTAAPTTLPPTTLAPTTITTTIAPTTTPPINTAPFPIFGGLILRG